MNTKRTVPEQKIPLEWVVGESAFPQFVNAESRGIHSVPVEHSIPDKSTERRPLLLLLRWVAIGCVACLLVTGAPSAQRLIIQEEERSGIEESLLREDNAWRASDFASYTEEFSPTINRQWMDAWRHEWNVAQTAANKESALQHSQILTMIPQNELIMVTVLVDRPTGSIWQLSPYAENRFYQLTADGWRRSAPDPSFWGSQKRLETAHLLLDYVEKDAPLIERLAPELERITVTLYTLAGITLPPPNGKQHLLFIPSLDTKWEAPGQPTEFVSPTLMQFNTALTLKEAFIDEVIRRQSHRMMIDARFGFLSNWQVLTTGMEIWLRNTVTEVPWPWYQEAEAFFAAEVAYRIPLTLSDITDDSALDLTPNQRIIWKYMAAYTLIEYAVDHYGSDAPARLRLGFASYRSWRELIPATFGVSVEAWEAGWNVYLVEKFQQEGR